MPKEDLNEMMSRLKMASLKQPGMINVRLELNPINGQMRIDIPQNPILVLGMLDMARAHVYGQIMGKVPMQQAETQAPENKASVKPETSASTESKEPTDIASTGQDKKEETVLVSKEAQS
jgi:hypothetical protein